MHRTFNGRNEKWAAMCAPKKVDNILHFCWYWMGVKGTGTVEEFTTSDIRYVHTKSDVISAASDVGFTVELLGEWLKLWKK